MFQMKLHWLWYKLTSVTYGFTLKSFLTLHLLSDYSAWPKISHSTPSDNTTVFPLTPSWWHTMTKIWSPHNVDEDSILLGYDGKGSDFLEYGGSKLLQQVGTYISFQMASYCRSLVPSAGIQVYHIFQELMSWK